jgi:hypothetical protein
MNETVPRYATIHPLRAPSGCGTVRQHDSGKGDRGLVELMMPSLKERLWHNMRRDLANYVPETNGNRLLMCCACGRFLPQDSFDFEHIVPHCPTAGPQG